MDNGTNRTTAEQSDLRNDLFDLIQEELRRTNVRTSTQQETLLPTIRELIYGYNENNRNYNENIRTTLQIIQNMNQTQNLIHNDNSTNRTNTSTSRRTHRPTSRAQQDTNMFLSYLIYPIRDLSANQFQDVVVRPTQEQLQAATQQITYWQTSINQTRCPITLEDFEDGQIVRQITHCGHTFCENAIQNWFLTNVRCPVCRYDIRTNIQAHPSPLLPDNLMDSLTTSIENMLQNYINEQPTRRFTNDLSFDFVYY
uniref:RING-type domain-containing protein n=1 Tax=viral metagenome TaxID=1070528 RepID=A0A6C0JLN7_9ZZZZ